MVTFRVPAALAEALRAQPNQTAFVEAALTDALARTCPTCGGLGRVGSRHIAVSNFKSAALARLTRDSALRLRQVVHLGRRLAATELALRDEGGDRLGFQLLRAGEPLVAGHVGRARGELALH